MSIRSAAGTMACLIVLSVLAPATAAFANPPVCDGTWQRLRRAHPLDASSGLNDVAVTGPTSAWAVGDYMPYDTRVSTPLVIRWNGVRWSRRRIDLGSTNATLRSVAARSNTNVWAVGSTYDSSSLRSPLVEHWDGATWRRIEVPYPSGENVYLTSVAIAPGSNDVWAVGAHGVQFNGEDPYVLHFDGAVWTQLQAAASGGWFRNGLEGVVAITRADAWTVGHQWFGGPPGEPLVFRLSGLTSEEVDTPTIPGFSTHFTGVDATGRKNVWSVGASEGAAFAERWNGFGWEIPEQPSVATSRLNDVTVVSTDVAWAVGSADLGSLIEQWDGTKWTLVPAPRFANEYGGLSLRGVDAVMATEAFAVGVYEQASGPRSFVMRFC